MANTSKRKLLFTTVFLTLLMFSSYAALIPNAQAAEMTIQQKGLTILNDVVGLDIAKYEVTIKEYPQDHYLGVLPQENVRYELQSNGSRIEMLYTVANGRLLMLNVLENQGSPHLTKTATGVADAARDFLNTYQSNTGNPLYGVLSSTILGVDSSKNLTTIVGNTKLEVSTRRDDLTDKRIFRWTYTFNGIEAPDKVVALGYENGFLDYFYDSWDLYKIGSTAVNVSEEEAISIGMARARNYSWPVAYENVTAMVKNFNVTGAMIWETVFRSSLIAERARDSDLLKLYPMRHVWVSMDKFYPGNVYGFNVYVWGDTGEVACIQERISTQDPPPELYATADDFTLVPLTTTDSAIGNGLSGTMNDKSSSVEASSNFSSTMLVGFSVIALLMLGSAVFWSRKKNGRLNRRLSKLGGVLLCLLAFSMLLAATSSVNAVNPQGRATIWTSRSMGAYNYSLGFSWRKAACEVEKQEETAASIASSFNSNGYDTSNYHGSIYYGVKERILAQISRSEALYPRAAVVVFDHGNGNDGLQGLPYSEFHFMFEDDNGTRIGGTYPGTTVKENGAYDYEIYPRTDLGKIFFAFINTCNSANIDDYLGSFYSKQGIVPGTERARGMPFAFTHLRPNIDMSGQGYWSNSGDFVYIGFNYGSAALAQSIDGSYPPYYQWVEHFFGYALTYDMSVSDALDQASAILWPGYEWWETPLYQGFTALWPMYIEGEWRWEWGTQKFYGEGWMRVYGNGNMHLYQKGGAWNFDENGGSTAYDSLFNNNGAINGASWVAGRKGSALSFDGYDDYVTFGNPASLNIQGAITIEAWIKVGAFDIDFQPILTKGDSSYRIQRHAETNYLAFGTNGLSNLDLVGTTNVNDGKWHHVAAVFGGSDDMAKYLYVDGRLEASVAVTGSLETNNYNVEVGHNQEWSWRFWDGSIDEARVYNYALSPEQIADDAAVASFHLNGGDTDYHYAYDSSPYGNTGTVYGASWTYGVRTSGVHSLALSFDGVDDYVSCGNPTNLDITDAVSVGAWIKVGAFDIEFQPIVTKGDSAYRLQRNAYTNYLAFGTNGLSNMDLVGSTNVNDGAWHYVVAVFGGSSDMTKYLYVDGVLDASVAVTGTLASNAYDVEIGHNQERADRFWEGVIDEVCIYDRALSADEIAAYYAANLPRHWLTVWAWNDEYSYPLYPWVKIDGQYTSLADVTRGTHTVEVEDWIEDPYFGWFYFDHFTYGSTTDYNNPMTLTVSKDTEVIAYYNWYGW